TIGHRLPDRLGGPVMALLGRTDEIVIGGVQHLGHALELGRVAVGQFPRRDALLARCLCHLDPVLVRAGHEDDVTPVGKLETRQRIRGDQLVGVADMRAAIRIGNRRRNEIAFSVHDELVSGCARVSWLRVQLNDCRGLGYPSALLSRCSMATICCLRSRLKLSASAVSRRISAHVSASRPALLLSPARPASRAAPATRSSTSAQTMAYCISAPRALVASASR